MTSLADDIFYGSWVPKFITTQAPNASVMQIRMLI